MAPSLKVPLRWVRMVFTAILVALLIWTIILMIFENRFIYFPQKYPKGAYDQARSIPGLRDCWFTAEDGIKLHGWFAPAEGATTTLVLSHGNAGNLSHRYLLMRSLQRRGYNVLMYDYRGYGRSEGSPDEEGVYSDGRAAFDFSCSLPEVHRDRIILWGTSLGGAVAIDVASHRAVAGLILESTFTSARDLAVLFYPFLPVRFFLRTRFDSINKIRNLSVPILVIHGSRDTIVPPGLGRRLFGAANEPKEFYEIPGADHNDTFFVGGEEYFSTIDRFLKTTLPPPAIHP